MTSLPGRFCLLVAALGLAAATAKGAPPDRQTLVYEILRNGGRLGTQSFVIRRGGDAVEADLGTELSYTLLGLEVYRFRQTGHEVWRAGRLSGLDVDTDDNGKHHQLTVRRGPDGRLSIRDGSRSLVAGDDLAAATLWNRDALSHGELIDSIDGSILKIRVEDGGEEAVMAGGRTETAHRYKVTGGLHRDLWYGPDGRLLRVSFTAGDGSQLEYRLVPPAE